MVFFVLALAALCFWKIKYAKFQDGYMEKAQTTDVKGIFAVIILFSHLRGYIALSPSFLDQSYNLFLGYIGQLMVTLFFFYSGYGIMQSYRKKENYSKSFFKNRFLKTLVHFDIAVLCYLVVSLILGQIRPWQDYVFCWIGWTEVGNSNWFIFDVFALYAVTLLAFAISKRKEKMLAVWTSAFCVVLWVALALIRKDESWWYNTLLCYPFGMWFALWKDKINGVLKKGVWQHYGAIVCVFVVFAALYIVYIKMGSEIVYSITACLFCLLISLITTKVKVGNPVLTWLGNNSFSIYILQRLPMIVFANFGWNGNIYVFAVLAIVATMLLAWLFDWVYKKVDALCFGRAKKEKPQEIAASNENQ